MEPIVATLYEDYEINQGTDATITHQFREIDGLARDLTGYTPSAKLKINYAQDTGTSFSAIVSSPVTDGTVVLTLTNTQTSALNPRYRYVYDLELSSLDSDSNTIIEIPLRGTVKVNPNVT